jgi:hypothetical protein
MNRLPPIRYLCNRWDSQEKGPIGDLEVDHYCELGLRLHLQAMLFCMSGGSTS